MIIESIIASAIIWGVAFVVTLPIYGMSMARSDEDFPFSWFFLGHFCSFFLTVLIMIERIDIIFILVGVVLVMVAWPLWLILLGWTLMGWFVCVQDPTIKLFRILKDRIVLRG